jgi:hypothetical protein
VQPGERVSRHDSRMFDLMVYTWVMMDHSRVPTPVPRRKTALM